MLKAEIITQAKAKGIVLSENMFERYYEYGLIVSDKIGQGYVRGVKTQYHERTIDAIELINKLKSNKSYKHQMDYIFVLYWKGYPIQWDKLKARLLEFYTLVLETFKQVDEFTNNPDYEEIIAIVAQDEVNKNKPIGRPSKSTQESLKRKSKVTAELFDCLLLLISNLYLHGRVNGEVLANMIELMQIDFLTEFNDSFQIHSIINISDWQTRLETSTEIDYIETSEVIFILKHYWSQLMCNYQSEYLIPLIGDLLKMFNDNYGRFNNADPTWNFKFYTLGLISSSFRQQLKEILTNPTTQEAWQQFIQVLLTQKQNSVEEVNLNG